MNCIYCKENLVEYPGSRGQSVHCIKCKIIFNKESMEQDVFPINNKESVVSDEKMQEVIANGTRVKVRNKETEVTAYIYDNTIYIADVEKI